MSRRDSGSDLSNSSKSGSSFDSDSGDGEQSANAEKSPDDSSNGSSASEEIKMITSNPKVEIDIENALKLIAADSENHLNDNDKTTIPSASIPKQSNAMTSNSADDSKLKEIAQNIDTNTDAVANGKEMGAKTQQLKAKFLRQQRKAEKQTAKANSTTMAPSSADCSEQRGWTKKGPNNIERTLKSLIDEMPNNGAHKLKVCVV